MTEDSQNKREIRFSVIIPAYNAEATIRAAILSCLEQTYPPFEIIVVDDRSNDQTVAIAQGFGTAVTVISSENNRGPSASRNIAWDHASGNYIAFLDADDTWHREKLALIKGQLEQLTDANFIVHPFTLSPLPEQLENVPNAIRLSFRRLLWRIPPNRPCHPSSVVIRNLPEYRFEETMRYMEDYDLWLRIAERHPLYWFPVALTRLGRPVLSKGGQSSNRWAMRKGEIRTYFRLAKRKSSYYLLLPILLLLSLFKHLIKKISG